MVTWYLYIIENCTKDRLYTGITTDPDRRLHEHNHNSRGAKYTKKGRPWIRVYLELCESQSDALRRERAVKKLSRAAKLKLSQLEHQPH